MSEFQVNFGALGMDLEQSLKQLKKGKLTYALNAMVEGFDGQFINYQNEQGNELCVTLPEGYVPIGIYTIYESNLIIYFLVNPTTKDSEIGKSDIDGCVYSKIINAPCLNFDVNHPILSAVHKIDNCSTQIFWVDGYNDDRFLDLENLPYKEIFVPGNCENELTSEIDCNKLAINPNFSIPLVFADQVESDGTLISGTYQFAVQYCNVSAQGYTSYYSVTNPVPLFNPNNVTLDFNTAVNKSIRVRVSNLNNTGYYDYFNLAVVKTVNDVSSVDLVGTYKITNTTEDIIYSGQKTGTLTLNDIFNKYTLYKKSKNITSVNDILIRNHLTTAERLSYQEIANKITLNWQTFKLTDEYTYADPIVSSSLRSYFRDEVYAFEIVFLLKDGRQTDRFHIPGRVATAYDLEIISNNDVVNPTPDPCVTDVQPQPRWKVYNTGNVSGFDPNYLMSTTKDCYKGPYQYGQMGYWESEEEYPCDASIWGELAGQKIRHHKLPDSVITHIHDNNGSIFPLGVRVDMNEIYMLLQNSSLTTEQKDLIAGFKISRGTRVGNRSVVARGLLRNVGKYEKEGTNYYFPNYPFNDLRQDPFIENTGSFFGEHSQSRFTFQSPDTSFYQPFLGNILKLETVEYGKANAHFVQVKGHAKYKLYNSNLYAYSLTLAGIVAALPSATAGTSPVAITAAPWVSGSGALIPGPGSLSYATTGNWMAGMTAYGIILDIFQKTVPYINYAWQYNAVGNYNDALAVANAGNKQRNLAISTYIIPGYAGVGDDYSINNYQRESSIYLKTQSNLPFSESLIGIPDNSRYTLGDAGLCDVPTQIQERDINAYYATIKNNIPNQYGQIYSYNSVDTGFQEMFVGDFFSNPIRNVFGGDCFINKFGFKSKLPFFIDERVNTIDGSDIDYRDIGNIGSARYWLSSAGSFINLGESGLRNIFGGNPDNLDCKPAITALPYTKGKMYINAIGIPYFYCESEVNVDYRQAFNNKEGDFYPHVGKGIPDEWLQPLNVDMNFDNTYYYNKTYSKQNVETSFSFLPLDYFKDKCTITYPFRAIFSEASSNDPFSTFSNNWLIYKASSFYDFPQSFGSLVSLDGMEYRQVLARFENRSQIYNALLTAPTNQADIYVGQPLFSSQTPPIDLAVTDMGYAGSRHKFLLKTEYGYVFVDDKRGHVFLLNGRQVQNLTLQDSGVEQFFNKNLEVQLPKYFPGVPIDNHFNGVGITGVYDAKYDRLIITKIDYIPSVDGIVYVDGKFYYNQQEIQLTDTNYFCNKSFTISFDFAIKSWVSFHTYIPSYYVGSSNFFLSGYNGQTWKHLTPNNFCKFYGEQAPYILEYPYSYELLDEILQSVQDYSKTLQYDEDFNFIEVNDVYYNKVILYNNQQCSGILKLAPKPKNNLNQYMKYPIYEADAKTILYTKSDNLYKINQFWSLVKDHKQPIFKKTCLPLSYDKELNQANMNYSKMSFKKAPLRAKDLRCRFILDDRTDTRIVSQLVVVQSQKSFK